MSQLFTSGGQSIGASASASVLPMNTQVWFPLGLTGLISLQSKGFSKASPPPQYESMSSLVLSLPYGSTETFIHDYWKDDMCRSHLRLFATPWTIASQAPLSMEFSRQEYWSGLPFPSPVDFPNPGTTLVSLASPALAGGFFNHQHYLGSTQLW